MATRVGASMELDDYGITLETLRSMYAEWQGGVPKSAIERRYIGKSTHHGKLFTKLVREHLHIDTEHAHPLRTEVERLRALLEQHGIDPDTGAASAEYHDRSSLDGDPE